MLVSKFVSMRKAIQYFVVVTQYRHPESKSEPVEPESALDFFWRAQPLSRSDCLAMTSTRIRAISGFLLLSFPNIVVSFGLCLLKQPI